MHTRTTTVLAAGLLVLVGTLTGCSAGGSPTGDHTEASSGAGYEACLREKGYDYPDQDAKDGLELHVPQGVDRDQFQQDLQGCLDATSDGGPGSVEPMSDADAAEYESKVAACVRAAGIEDFPDDADAREPVLQRNPAAEEVLEKCYDEVIDAERKAAGK